MEVQRPCLLFGHSSSRLRTNNSVELLLREEEEEEVFGVVEGCRIDCQAMKEKSIWKACEASCQDNCRVVQEDSGKGEGPWQLLVRFTATRRK